MCKSVLLLGLLRATGALCSIATRGAHGNSLQSQTRATWLLDTTDPALYVVVSCKRGQAACVDQCAEVSCASDAVGHCPLSRTSRQVVRVADRCASCPLGALRVSRAHVEQLSGTSPSGQWVAVRWRYVDCAGEGSSSSVQETDGTTRAASSSQTYTTSTFEDAVKEPTRDGVLHYLASSDDDDDDDGAAEVVDTSFGPSRVANDSGSQMGTNGSGSYSDRTFALPSGSSSTAPPDDSSSSSSSSSSDSGALPPPPTLTFPRTVSTFDRVSSSDDNASSSTAASSGTVNEDASYSVGTVTTADIDSLFNSTSTGKSGATDPLPTPTTEPSAHVPDGDSDDTSMATSAVTKSPFFYAAILLGLVGLIGLVVGHRAKQKRSGGNARRAFQRSVGTVTPTSASCPARLSRTTRASRHTIAIL
ncbi:unnamed protein product [Hyaloperonospora brassicae]|uniref:Expansin-like EG45 domain-containing protein n=1 Tax=Hyaloperonospora brassicae TaxID=162125 RepID=A0AAV0U9X6_HYABA|nr:unnamed protein product [Hyaloperonospora brassicae]